MCDKDITLNYISPHLEPSSLFYVYCPKPKIDIFEGRMYSPEFIDEILLSGCIYEYDQKQYTKYQDAPIYTAPELLEYKYKKPDPEHPWEYAGHALSNYLNSQTKFKKKCSITIIPKKGL